MSMVGESPREQLIIPLIILISCKTNVVHDVPKKRETHTHGYHVDARMSWFAYYCCSAIRHFNLLSEQ